MFFNLQFLLWKHLEDYQLIFPEICLGKIVYLWRLFQVFRKIMKIESVKYAQYSHVSLLKHRQIDCV